MNYYPFHLGDFIKKTSHLTLIEDAIYRRLIDLYFDTELPIPNKTKLVSRRIRASNEEVTVGIILQEFFYIGDDGMWHNHRCDEEINKYIAKAEVARANGLKGGRPKKAKKTKRVNLDNRKKTKSKTNQEPRTKNQEPNIKDKEEKIPFLLFWENYPLKKGKSDAQKIWGKLSIEAQQLAINDSVIRYTGTEKKYIRHGSTYLNKKTWEDEITEERKNEKNRPIDNEITEYGETSEGFLENIN